MMIKKLKDILKHPKVSELAACYGHSSISSDFKERRIDNPQNLRLLDILVMSKILGIEPNELFELALKELEGKDPLSFIKSKPWAGRTADAENIETAKKLYATKTSVPDIAKKLNVSRQTIYRYLKK